MIYFVDEDVSQVRPFATELILRGYEVESIRDADEAFRRLSRLTECNLVIIDVMLAVDISAETSRYTRENTIEFTRTGLRLLEDLVVENGALFPRRAILFSMATSREIVAEIERVSGRLGVPFLRKSEFGTPHAFGERIVAFLKKLSEEAS